MKRLSILIVDDNRYFIKRMTDLLKGLDSINNINTALNFKDASSIIGRRDHDLVLLDIQLPDGNGMNLLKAIKDSRSRSEVIMITNSCDEHYRKQCEDLGALYFLDKTNDFDLVPGLLTEIRNY